MLLHIKFKKLLLKHFSEMRWQGVVLAIVSYIASSWFFLSLSGESAITSSVDFFYWLIVTASTVGYGDLSPVTTAGKYVTVLYIIPLGLGLFALTVGRIAGFMSFQWRKGVTGLKDLNFEEHILIIGWDAKRTPHLIKLLIREQSSLPQAKKIVLCVLEDMLNPMPEDIGFIRARSFNDDECMSRACIEQASCIIVDNPSDDITMTAALYAYSRNTEAHLIAFFKDENLGRLLKKHCPTVEYTPSVSVEMLAKAAMDPGSSILHQQLLNVEEGMTQYSVCYPEDAITAKISSFFAAFKQHHDAILIGISDVDEQNIIINPSFDYIVNPGCKLYYIADERIATFDWEKMHVK
ncbi:MAG: two pore domain potassium channel family protein [Pseudomonadales bacterium]|nr:two pore domain potassium channel family protein [Pseudomonadales bacterium]